jgi:hypothetical protein
LAKKGRWWRPAAGRCGRERDKLWLETPLLVEVVALDLHIELRAERLFQHLQPRLGEVRPALPLQRPVERAGEPAGERDEAGRMLFKAGAPTLGGSPSGTSK